MKNSKKFKKVKSLFYISGTFLFLIIFNSFSLSASFGYNDAFSFGYDVALDHDEDFISNISGLVPYTGATTNVDLGAYNLEATKVGIGKTPGVPLDISAVNNAIALKISNSLTPTTYMALQFRGGGVNAIPRMYFYPDGNGYLDIWQSHPYYAFLVHDSSGWGGFGLDPLGHVRLSSSSTSHDVQILTGNYGTINTEFKGGGNVEMNYNMSVSDNLGINTTTPSYPVEVNSEINGISIYALGNISATGYNTRTSVYNKDQGSALDKIKDSDYYKDEKGEIDHSKFYGYVGEIMTVDYDQPVYINKTVQDHEKTIEVFNEVTGELEITYPFNTTVMELTYPYTKAEEQVSLTMEIDVLRQALYELSEDHKELQIEVNKLKK